MGELSWMAEYAAFAVMLALSTVVGLYYGCVERKQNTVDEYMLGGRRMSVFPITVSLIASHVSGISLLGVPSETYSYGTQYLMVSASNLLVVVIILYVYLPVFYELQFATVYEYLEHRFDSKIRGLASLIFTVSLILYMPVLIYVPALAFNQVTKLNIHLITLIICIICIFYTTIGGLKAVVWTDTIQSVFTNLSIIILVVLGFKEIGGFSNMINSNFEGGRIEFFKMDPDPFLRNTFWTSCIGMPFLSLTQLAIHPGVVQRFIALPTYNKARKSLIYSILGFGLIKVLMVTIGMLIYTKYKNCDPVSAKYIKNDGNLVPFYVMDIASNFPGLTGLFISGIVSAALSTMSAQLNTVSGTIYEDLIVKIIGIQFSDLIASIIIKCIVVVIGIICVALVMVVDKLNGILQVAISLTGITSGAMLSVFTLGLCFPWANSRGAICGMLVSLGVMSWIVIGAQFAIYNNELKFIKKDFSVIDCPDNITLINHIDLYKLLRLNDDVYVSPNVWKIYSVSYMHYSFIGTFVGIAVGLAISLLFPTDQNVDPKLLTPFIQKLMKSNYRKKIIQSGPNTDEYKQVSRDIKL